MQDIAQKFELQGGRKQVAIELDFPSRLPFVVADIGLIERVLENLIGNAITHTPEGGRVRSASRWTTRPPRYRSRTRASVSHRRT